MRRTKRLPSLNSPKTGVNCHLGRTEFGGTVCSGQYSEHSEAVQAALLRQGHKVGMEGGGTSTETGLFLFLLLLIFLFYKNNWENLAVEKKNLNRSM